MPTPPPPNFKRSPVPPAAPAAKAPALNLPTGGPPLRTGTPYIHSSTKQALEPLGWKDGDPIPAGFAEALQAAVARANDGPKIHPDADPNQTSIQPQRTSDIADLPPEEQAQLKELLALAKADAEAARMNPGPQLGNMVPSVRQILEKTLETPTTPAASIIDDRDTALPPTPPPAADPPPAPATSPTESPQPTVGEGGGVHDPQQCPRCLLDLQQPYVVEPTSEDKVTFMAALLGGTRFTQRVNILDGQMVVTFRSLTVAESRAIFEQLTHDGREGRVAHDADFYMKLQDYRLACSIESIQVPREVSLVIIPELFKIPFDPDPEHGLHTPVPQMLTYVMANVIPQEPLQRVVGRLHKHFQRLVETLEARTDEPSFWEGIAQQA